MFNKQKDLKEFVVYLKLQNIRHLFHRARTYALIGMEMRFLANPINSNDLLEVERAWLHHLLILLVL